MPRTGLFALTLPAFLTAACVVVPPAERAASCRATDWYSYGRNDGLLGVPVSERAAHFSDCAGLGYPADRAAYQAGHADGLRDYCTAANGYEEGYSGRRYRNVCPPQLEAAFLQGYAQGRSARPIGILPFFDWDTDVYDDDSHRHKGDRHKDDRDKRGRDRDRRRDDGSDWRDRDRGDRDKSDGGWHGRNKDQGGHDWRDRDRGDRDRDGRDSDADDSDTQDWDDRDSEKGDTGDRDDGIDRDWEDQDRDDHRDDSDDDDDEIRHRGTEA